MKMDHQVNENGQGKYALLNLRKLKALRGQIDKEGRVLHAHQIDSALRLLTEAGVLYTGDVGTEYEFFPVVLKDTNAHAAIRAYAVEARRTDPEWADQVMELTKRAGPNSPFCKTPD